MRGVGEVFQTSPGAADGEGCPETPEHGLDEDGTLKLVGLFGNIETDDGDRTDERDCRQYGEKVDHEAGGMGMVQSPLGYEDKENVDKHRWEEAVVVAARGFRWVEAAWHDNFPFHKDNFTLHRGMDCVKGAC